MRKGLELNGLKHVHVYDYVNLLWEIKRSPAKKLLLEINAAWIKLTT